MSWSRAGSVARGRFALARALAAAGMVLAAASALGACSFSPVYGDHGRQMGQSRLELAYAKPNSRLEQVIYQELALRFGTATAENAPLLQVSASSSAARVGESATSNPNESIRVTVTASATITMRDGSATQPIRLTRHASADYTSSNQILAAEAARAEAGERAARSAAESLRLAIFATLGR